MAFSFPFFVARRYLVSKKSQNAINIISGIAVGGVAIITAALVIVLSAFNGLSDLVKTLYSSFDPDIEVVAREGKSFDPTTSTFAQVKKLKGILYWSETIEENILIKKGDQQCVATLKGVNDDFVKMSHIDTLVEEGIYRLEGNNENYAVLGKGISYLLKANAGDMLSPITLYAPKRGRQKSSNPEEGFNERHTMVSGIFAINDEFDYKYALVPLHFAREILGYTNDVTALEIGIAAGTDAEKTQDEIKTLLGKDFAVKNRYEQNELLFKTLSSEKLWTFIILGFILLIAIFNVVGSLSMIIIEKKKDTLTLWYMGAGIPLIRKMFLYEGIMVTFIGAMAGLIIGIGLCLIQIHTGIIHLQEGFVIDAYPVTIRIADIFFIIGIIGVIGFLAAWYPVRVFSRKFLVQ